MVKVAFFKQELEIPDGVEVILGGNHHITVKGPDGEVTKDFSHIRGVKVSVEDKNIIFSTNFPKSGTLALANTIYNIIKSLIIGVQTNYKYHCKIAYSHFPFTAEFKKNKQEIHIINFLGERAPRIAKSLKNVDVKVEGEDIVLIGPNKENLGQTAANLKRSCRIKKKDPRVFQDGIYLYKIQVGDEILWQIR